MSLVLKIHKSILSTSAHDHSNYNITYPLKYGEENFALKIHEINFTAALLIIIINSINNLPI